MVTIDEILVHPLYSALIGAVVSGVLVGVVTHKLENRRKEMEMKVQERWKEKEIEAENRRKEMEIKADIVLKMSEVIDYQKINAIISTDRKIKVRREDDEIAATGKNLREWYVDANKISSKLQTYFPETGLREKWEWYYQTLLAFTNVSRDYFFEDSTHEQRSAFQKRLKIIRDYFSDDKQIDWDRFTTQMTFDNVLWGDVGNLFSKRGDEIVGDVLKSPIRAF